MKTVTAMKGLGLAASLLLATVVPHAALAAATAAGVDVANNVTLDFEVNGLPQGQLTDQATFKVDHKVVLTVDQSGAVQGSVTPGSQFAVPYTVTDDGNYSVGGSVYSFSNLSATSSDTNVVTIDGIYSDAACTTSIGNPSTHTQVSSNGGGSITVYVCATVKPGAAVNATANVSLTSQATWDNGGTWETTDQSATNKNTNLNNMLVIFADDASDDDGVANNGTTEKEHPITVAAAALTLSKGVTVVSDPTGAVSPNAHAIPGAVVEYTVTITNSGANDATALEINDTLNTNTTYVSGSIKVNSTDCSGDGSVTLGNGSTAACVDSTAPALKVSGFKVVTSETVTIVYRATLQ